MPLFNAPIWPNLLASGRLTTESGVPVSNSDRTSQGTLYYTPFTGNVIALFNGTDWYLLTFSEISLALTLTSGKNYDVFAYDNAGTLALELSAAWTNDTTRADALALQDGVYVKSGATTRRWLGTIRASGSNVTEDSDAKRFVMNAVNRVLRTLHRDTGASYSYASSTIRQMNASASNQVELVNGFPNPGSLGSVVLGCSCNLESASSASSQQWGYVGVGENSTTAYGSASSTGQSRMINDAASAMTKRITVMGRHVTIPRTGYSYFAMLEQSTFGTVTFDGGELIGQVML